MATRSGSLPGLSRRQALGLLGGATGAALLAACGEDGGDDRAGGPPAPGGAVPEPTGRLITRWLEDPFARGSYSYLAVGATPDLRRALAAPVDERLWFAGEAASSDAPATVHGALLSGRQVLYQEQSNAC